MKKAFLFMAMAAISFTACKKGDTGPQGPQGVAGTNGTNGTNGVANITSNVVTINASDWVNGGGGFYYSDFTSTRVTNDVINGGMVCMFHGGDAGVWVAMPYQDLGINYGFNIYNGGFRIFCYTTSGATISFTGSMSYKVVVIPPAMRAANPGTNWKDYNQVMAVMAAQNTL